jgi:putative transposase
VRKTYTENRRPAPAHERAREEVLWRGRERSTAALAHRLTAWQRGRVWVARSEQEADRTAMRAELREDAALPAHLLHDVLARLDTTYQACLRRVQRGEQAGVPRFKGRKRCPSFPCKE